MTLTTVGYGDVTPVTDAERAFLVIAMMFGGICYSYIIASMASIVSTMDSNERLFNEKMVHLFKKIKFKLNLEQCDPNASPQSTAHSSPPGLRRVIHG